MKNNRLWFSLLLASTLVLIPAWAGEGNGKKMSASLDQKVHSGKPDRVDVILMFHQRPADDDDAGVGAGGGTTKHKYKKLPMRLVSVPATALNGLMHNPNIRFIAEDAPVMGMSTSALETSGLPDVPINLNIQSSGIGVAVLDSGVGNHVDLWPSPIQYDFTVTDEADYDDDDLLYGLYDGYGHGTHVAGIIAGDGYDSDSVYRGVAPYADIISLRVLDSEGKGSTSHVLFALDWLLANRQQFNIRVANLSLGKPVEEEAAYDPLVYAVEELWNKGVVVVCSAGNYGRDGNFTITSPGNSRRVITVGSVTDGGTGQDLTDDYVSSYSSRGPTLFDHFVKPDLVAPGNRLVAPVAYEAEMKTDLADRLVDCGKSQCSGAYLELSGTSMAAAMVSGAAARMLEAEPNLNPDSIKARLMLSARKSILGDPLSTGAGMLDIAAALADNTVVQAAPSPKAIRNDQTGQMGFENTAVLWSDANLPQAVLWSDAVLWADTDLEGNAALWTD